MTPFGWTKGAWVLAVIVVAAESFRTMQRSDTLVKAVFAEAISDKSSLTSAVSFLSFPLDITCEGRPCTPFTARVSAVQDHSVPTGYNCNKRGNCDGVVQAYNGEEGRKNSGENCPPPGYKSAGGAPFLVNVLNYVGAGCPPKYGAEASGSPQLFLNYDGHSGYDFPYPQASILAPADGTLFQATTDSINGSNRKDIAWEGWHTFYIDHSNGYTTWYLHCRALTPQVWEEIKQKGSAQVKQGEAIAYVGRYGGVPPHLHFEVRRGLDEVVDPYAAKLWKEERPARGKLYPVDEGVKDASFVEFRKQLLDTIARRDSKSLLSVVHKDIKIGFGGEDGIEKFRELWRPEDPDSLIWKEIGDILKLGGTFGYASYPKTTFWAPYVFGLFPSDYGFNYGAIVERGVQVRAAPTTRASTLATLSVTPQHPYAGRKFCVRVAGDVVRVVRVFQPCLRAVERTVRQVAKVWAPPWEQKPPEIFCRTFLMRRSRSA